MAGLIWLWQKSGLSNGGKLSELERIKLPKMATATPEPKRHAISVMDVCRLAIGSGNIR